MRQAFSRKLVNGVTQHDLHFYVLRQGGKISHVHNQIHRATRLHAPGSRHAQEGQISRGLAGATDSR